MVSAEAAGARVALVTKGALQSCNSAKAQGGIQAAFAEDDSPEQHAADVWASSHETADIGLVEILTSEAPAAIHWLEEQGVEFTRDSDNGRPSGGRGGYRLARCGGATRKRLLQVGDRTGHAITKSLRRVVEGSSADVPQVTAGRPRADDDRMARPLRRSRDRSRCRRAGSRRPLLPRGGRARGALYESAGATGEVTQIALGLGAEPRDLDALQYHPNGGVAGDDAGLLDSGDHARVRRSPAQRRRRGVHRFARPPRRRLAGDLRRGGQGKGVESPDGRPAVYLDTTRIPEADADISLPYMLRRYRGGGIDPLSEPILTYPVLHYQNGGLVIDEHGETTLPGSSPAARSPVVRTGGTG